MRMMTLCDEFPIVVVVGAERKRTAAADRARTHAPRAETSLVDDDDRASGERLSCPHPCFAPHDLSASATAGRPPFPKLCFPSHSAAPAPLAAEDPPLQQSPERVRASSAGPPLSWSWGRCSLSDGDSDPAFVTRPLAAAESSRTMPQTLITPSAAVNEQTRATQRSGQTCS